MKKTNNLDERQEQALLHIESTGFWFGFWGLLVSMAVQFIISPMNFATIAGEWIVFMAMALYVGSACLKNNIWDRKLKPTIGTNCILSIIAALVCGLLVSISVIKNYPEHIKAGLMVGAFIAVFIFIICFASLSLCAAAYKKNLEKSEKEPSDDMTMDDDNTKE